MVRNAAKMEAAAVRLNSRRVYSILIPIIMPFYGLPGAVPGGCVCRMLFKIKEDAFMSNTVLVTGADGFIGSHLTEELVKKGERVKAF